MNFLKIALVVVSFALIGTTASADLGFAEFGEVKRAAQKVGRYIGAGNACDERSYAIQFKEIEGKEVRAQFLTNLEKVGLTRSELTEIDDAMIEAENSEFDKFQRALATSAASQGFEFCGLIFLSGKMIKMKGSFSYDTAAEVASTYSDAIPLN